MPELDQCLERWRTAARARCALSDEQLDELQEHLRAGIDEELSRGCAPNLAFERASARLGDVHDLERHYPRQPIDMNHASRMLGLALSAAVVLFTLGQSPAISSFFEPVILMIVLGLVAGGLLAGHGSRALAQAARCALLGQRPTQPAQCEELLALARRGYRLSWVSGFLSMMMSTLVALSAMESPALFYSALARASFGVLYGGLLAELLFSNLACWASAADRVR